MATHQPAWRPQTHQPITWSWTTYGYVIHFWNCICRLPQHLGLFWQAIIRLGTKHDRPITEYIRYGHCYHTRVSYSANPCADRKIILF